MKRSSFPTVTHDYDKIHQGSLNYISTFLLEVLRYTNSAP